MLMDPQLTSRPLPSLSSLNGGVSPGLDPEYEKRLSSLNQLLHQRWYTTATGIKYLAVDDRAKKQIKPPILSTSAATTSAEYGFELGVPRTALSTPASRAGSRGATPGKGQRPSTSDRPGSQAGSRPGSHAGSRPGSQAGALRPSSQGPLRPTSSDSQRPPTSAQLRMRAGERVAASWSGPLTALIEQQANAQGQVLTLDPGARLGTPDAGSRRGRGGSLSRSMPSAPLDFAAPGPTWEEHVLYSGINRPNYGSFRPGTSSGTFRPATFGTARAAAEQAILRPGTAPGGFDGASAVGISTSAQLRSLGRSLNEVAAALAGDSSALSRAQTAPTHKSRQRMGPAGASRLGGGGTVPADTASTSATAAHANAAAPPRTPSPGPSSTLLARAQTAPSATNAGERSPERVPWNRQTRIITDAPPRYSSPDQRPSRGEVYSVFRELDRGSGKLTFSTFEDAGIKIGMRPEQINHFFQLLDPQERGYATVSDWGNPSLGQYVSDFARLYVHETRGPLRTPDDLRKASTLDAAIQLALMKLRLRRNHGFAVPEPMLLEAFKFVDAQDAGVLSGEQLKDAFRSMGVDIHEDVTREAALLFNANLEAAATASLSPLSALIPYQDVVRHVYSALAPDPTREARRKHVGSGALPGGALSGGSGL